MAERLTAGCSGKHGYPTEATAEAVAKRQRRKQDSPIHAYRCNRCSRWHIGNIDRERALAAPRRLQACACGSCACPRRATVPRRICWRCRHGRHEPEVEVDVPRETEVPA